jgi:hypothetical protein
MGDKAQLEIWLTHDDPKMVVMERFSRSKFRPFVHFECGAKSAPPLRGGSPSGLCIDDLHLICVHAPALDLNPRKGRVDLAQVCN